MCNFVWKWIASQPNLLNQVKFIRFCIKKELITRYLCIQSDIVTSDPRQLTKQMSGAGSDFSIAIYMLSRGEQFKILHANNITIQNIDNQT